MSVGEVGCALSHIGVWETVILRDLSFAIVLEDDAIFDSGKWDVPKLSSTIKKYMLQEDSAVH